MSVSPKYRSNFSVNDILSPLEQHSTAAESSYLSDNNIKSQSVMSAVPVSTPFGVHVPQLGMSVAHHHPSHPHGHSAASSAFSSGSQYVNGASELSSAYGDVRAPPAPWYSSGTTDPRFASDYTLSTGKLILNHHHHHHRYGSMWDPILVVFFFFSSCFQDSVDKHVWWCQVSDPVESEHFEHRTDMSDWLISSTTSWMLERWDEFIQFETVVLNIGVMMMILIS